MIQEMEKELENIKKKNIHESIINTKESRINNIIEALNNADDFINLLVFQISSMNLEVRILENQMTKWLSNEDKLKEFASDSNTMEMVEDMLKEFKKCKDQ